MTIVGKQQPESTASFSRKWGQLRAAGRLAFKMRAFASLFLFWAVALVALPSAFLAWSTELGRDPLRDAVAGDAAAVAGKEAETGDMREGHLAGLEVRHTIKRVQVCVPCVTSCKIPSELRISLFICL